MTDARPRILVVEDERRMRSFLTALLEGHGFVVTTAESGEDAIREAATRNPEIILLDLGLPDLDGLEVTRRLREWGEMPIIVVSARGREQDKVDALDLGADDYLTKPFGARELLARIRVALRHRARVPGGEPTTVFQAEHLEVDLARRRVLRQGEPVELTPTEFKLLATFVRHAGRVLTHQQILKAVWGQAYVRHTHYVRVYVAQLRAKIEEDPSRPTLIVTETGVGYRFHDP